MDVKKAVLYQFQTWHKKEPRKTEELGAQTKRHLPQILDSERRKKLAQCWFWAVGILLKS